MVRKKICSLFVDVLGDNLKVYKKKIVETAEVYMHRIASTHELPLFFFGTRGNLQAGLMHSIDVLNCLSVYEPLQLLVK